MQACGALKCEKRAMLLAIDAGNTNIVFAAYKGTERVRGWRCVTGRFRTDAEYAAWLRQEGLDFGGVEAAVLCSVVPDADPALIRLCERNFGAPPLLVTHENAGMETRLRHPERAGADRLVNAVAVKAFYKYPAVVVDFGTATTFDVVDSEGIFRGGIIAPGVNLSAQALHSATAKLPRIENIEKPAAVIGADTVPAMQSGLYWGYVSMVEGLLARIGAEMGAKPFVIATGGLSGLFAESLPSVDAQDPDLTLRGLVYIYETCGRRTAA